MHKSDWTMIECGNVIAETMSTPLKQSRNFFSKSQMDSFTFRNKTYASPSVALEDYINTEFGERKIQSKLDDVEDLLLSRITFDSPRSSANNSPKNAKISDRIENKRNFSINHMVDKAYQQLQAIKKQSIGKFMNLKAYLYFSFVVIYCFKHSCKSFQ